jgi:hypothetical protein
VEEEAVVSKRPRAEAQREFRKLRLDRKIKTL